MECNLLLAVCACVHVRACVCLTTLFFGTQLSSQETATAALLKWGYFTDNQRFAKAPVSGQMKGLTPQGRNCCLFFFAALFRIPTSLHTPPPPLSVSLWLCPHTPQAPCQPLFTRLILGRVSEASFRIFSPNNFFLF